MNAEEEAYFEELEQQLREQNRTNKRLYDAQSSMFETKEDASILKYQLDLSEEMDKYYHLLRGDIIKEDEKGNKIYIQQDDDDLKPFNEFGVQLIMNVLSFYLSKNTILSNYDDDMINRKVLNLGIEVSDLIHNRYEEMMMTTSFEKEFVKLYKHKPETLPNGRMYITFPDGNKYFISEEMINRVDARLERHLIGKVKMYSIIVRCLIDSVHSSYRRAIHGEEKKILRSIISITQNDNGRGNMIPQNAVQQMPSKKSLLNPLTWFK